MFAETWSLPLEPFFEFLHWGDRIMSRQLFDAMWDWSERLTQAHDVLLCMDFDGTLAPIVEEPPLAQLSPQLQRVLLSLAGHESLTLVIVSGRERNDLQARVG